MPKVIDLPTSTSMTDSDYLIMEQSSGGTKKITRDNALYGIGSVVSATNSITSIATSTDTNMCQINLTKGTWVITAQLRISIPSTGKFLVGSISTTSATEQPSTVGGYGQISNAITGYHTLNLSRIYQATGNTTIYLVCWHNAGANATTLANQCNLRAVRIR